MSKKAEYQRKYNNANKDKVRVQKRLYRLANKDKINEQRRQRRLANSDKFNEQKRQYRKKNRDRINEKKRQIYHANNGVKADRNNGNCKPSQKTIDTCQRIMELCGLKWIVT